jgi:ABC-2 type transport system ATP-binding protein
VGIGAGAVLHLRSMSGFVVAEGQSLRGCEVNGNKPQRNGEDVAKVAEDFLVSSADSSASSAVNQRAMSTRPEHTINFDNVSKFYGEILGVNRVTLSIPPGITSLVGPNGAGKTTLMNLMTGLLRPTRGTVTVLGIPTDRPEELFSKVGYCSQFDSFPRGLTGREFIRSFLMVSGFSKMEAEELTTKALERVDLLSAGNRKIGAYSKGMRQRVRLAQSIAHQPSVLILDEPLNGLDPMVRAETIALFKQLAAEGLHLIISSHILHEVDMMSDRVVLLNNGYVVAEGAIHGVRDEMDAEHPMQVLIRCDKPSVLAARMFTSNHLVEARMHDDRHGLFVKTRDPDKFYLLLNEVVAKGEIEIESVAPVDDDLSAVYEYLIGSQ